MVRSDNTKNTSHRIRVATWSLRNRPASITPIVASIRFLLSSQGLPLIAWTNCTDRETFITRQKGMYWTCLRNTISAGSHMSDRRFITATVQLIPTMHSPWLAVKSFRLLSIIYHSTRRRSRQRSNMTSLSSKCQFLLLYVTTDRWYHCT